MLVALLGAALSLFAAHAPAFRAVPAGGTAVTAMLCEAPDGGAAAFQAMADPCASLGLPLLDFDDLAQAGAGGGDARARLDAALARLELHPQQAREAMRAAPSTCRPRCPGGSRCCSARADTARESRRPWTPCGQPPAPTRGEPTTCPPWTPS